MQTNSIILNTDSYKTSMFEMYPDNISGVYSYIESRGGKYNKTLFFGLQAYIKEYLAKPITQQDIDYAEKIILAHGEPFNRKGWEYILNKYNGYLPLVIKSVAEGSIVPTHNVLVTIENTDPECYWLTTYVETSLLRAIWYPTTVATVSWSIKQVVKEYLEKSGTPSKIDFMLNDFGSRGVSSNESSGIGGAAHLINFKGTDNILGILFADKYYNSGVCGYSVRASEHSVSTSYGKDERQYMLNLLNQCAKDDNIVSVVADTYDVFKFCEMIGSDSEIKSKIVEHGNRGGTIVIRPDSGDPVIVNRKLLQILSDGFGYTVNSKGFKVLNYVRLIQGDGVNELSIRSVLGAIMAHGWSSDNIVFGMGGALLQQVDRDMQRFAMKASAVCLDGNWVGVSKDPITDKGKKSKKGRVDLFKDSTGEFYSGIEGNAKSELVEVYRNGKLMIEYSFDDIEN